MIASSIGGVEILLLVAALVALIAQRLHVPYTVGLVLGGIALTLLPLDLQISLSPELILIAFLPPLIFEAAMHLRWRELRREMPVVITFAGGGVLISAVVTTLGMHYLAGWAWESASIFGALISATDPVSVIATFKEAGIKGRLRLLVEAESLLNDGAAAVLFVMALTVARGEGLSGWDALVNFVSIVGGGIACGAVVAAAMLFIAGKTTDHSIEITLTTAAAYGSFLFAEHLHASGVLATLTAGLMVGNLSASGAISERGREAVISFWDYAAFVANSLIFVLIGVHEARQPFASVALPALLAIAVVMLSRAAAIYPTALLFWRSERLKLNSAYQHILVWGGLRGALALALALGLPPEMPGQSEIITVTFAVVAFSIVVQGLTMTPLLRRLGVMPGR